MYIEVYGGGEGGPRPLVISGSVADLLHLVRLVI